MLSPESTLMAYAALVVFAAAFLSSIAGFAFSALAGAALLHLFHDPVRVVAVMIGCSILIQAYTVWMLRSAIEWRALARFVLPGLLTVPLGLELLTRLPAAYFAAGLGVFLVAYSLYLLLRRDARVFHAPWQADVAIGALGGLCGGLAGFPGAPMTIWCGLRGWSKERQRGLCQPYILAMQLEALALLARQAPWALSGETLVLYAPMALAAATLGLATFRRLNDRQFKFIVTLMLLASGIALLGGAL